MTKQERVLRLANEIKLDALKLYMAKTINYNDYQKRLADVEKRAESLVSRNVTDDKYFISYKRASV